MSKTATGRKNKKLNHLLMLFIFFLKGNAVTVESNSSDAKFERLAILSAHFCEARKHVCATNIVITRSTIRVREKSLSVITGNVSMYR